MALIKQMHVKHPSGFSTFSPLSLTLGVYATRNNINAGCAGWVLLENVSASIYPLTRILLLILLTSVAAGKGAGKSEIFVHAN